MNIILNTPLPVSAVSKKDFDNKILFLFLLFMAVMVGLGLLFVDVTKSFKIVPSVEKPSHIQQSEFV